MEKIVNWIIIFALIIIPAFSIAQSIGSEVFSSTGNTGFNNNRSLSYTIGEPVINYYSNDYHKIVQGFQHPEINIVLSGFDYQFFALLEGSFQNGQMTTALNQSGILSLSQPYSIEPWNYTGTEAVPNIPNSDIVDWILVELRDAPNVEVATSDRTISRKACFILKDGSIVDIDGSGLLQFTGEVVQQLFLVIRHRNHLDIISAFPLSKSEGVYTYNFTDSSFKAYGGPKSQTELDPSGLWAMIAADGNADGQINNKDKNDVWLQQLGETGYKQGDFNMDGYVEGSDKSDYWNDNSGKATQEPD